MPTKKKPVKKRVVKAKKNEPFKLDIACGQVKQDGWFGVDICKVKGVDVVHDLEKFPWPFKDNSVDEARCSHFIEHTKDIIAFMEELYRILKPGAKCEIIAPYYTSIRCWQDPTHTRAISENTFLYYDKKWREANKLDHYRINCDFTYTFGYNIDGEWAGRSQEAKLFAIKHYWNVVSDVHVTVEKRAE